MNCKTCGHDGRSDRVACPREDDPKMGALRTAVMALAYAAEKLPEVQQAYDEVSAAIESAVQQASEAVGPEGVRAALRTDWSDPASGRWDGDDNIESPFNACQHRGYCMSLKAAPRAQEPVGWKLVPVDPTDTMLSNGRWSGCADVSINEMWARRECYSRMLAAAPQLATAPRQPLTNEQIDIAIARSTRVETSHAGWVVLQRREYARAIEHACAEQWGVKLEGGAA